MRVLSAADSVSPAIQRTRDLLFRPFRWGTYLKLGLVAIVTEGLSSNSNFNKHTDHSTGNGPMLNPPFDITPVKIAAAVAAVLLAMLIGFFIAYLITRLRFAFFHCLATNTTEIGPGWHLYRDKAARFFWLNVAVGLCFILVIAAIAIPFAAGFYRVFRTMPPGGHPDWGMLIALILPLIPIVFLIILSAILTDIVMRDWMLPHYALEDATAREAWSEVWHSITCEKRQFFVYVVLRLVLPFIALVGLFILLVLPGAALVGAIAAAEYAMHSVFSDASGVSAIIGTLVQVFFGVVALGLGILVSICLGGPLSTATREYALVFYGGRYQPLGDLLYPPMQPPLQ